MSVKHLIRPAIPLLFAALAVSLGLQPTDSGSKPITDLGRYFYLLNDEDGDGYREVGAPVYTAKGQYTSLIGMWILSGSTGEVIRRVHWPAGMEVYGGVTCGDRDGQGQLDLCLAGRLPDRSSSLVIFSLESGDVLETIDEEASSLMLLGYGPLGSVDNALLYMRSLPDRVLEVVVYDLSTSEPSVSCSSRLLNSNTDNCAFLPRSNGKACVVLPGALGSAGILWCSDSCSELMLVGQETRLRMETVLAGADLNRDGKADFCLAEVDRLLDGVFGGVTAFSSEGDVLWTYKRPQGQLSGFGAGLAFCPDLTGDDVQEVITGAVEPWAKEGHFTVLDGATGQPICTVSCEERLCGYLVSYEEKGKVMLLAGDMLHLGLSRGGLIQYALQSDGSLLVPKKRWKVTPQDLVD